MRYFIKSWLFLFFFSSVSLGSSVYAQPYQAQVIDAETKQPIEGAAVLAVWRLESPGIVHPVESIHDALETVTDQNGNFTISGIIAAPIDPQAKITVLFTIFKPGYEAYKAGSLRPMSSSFSQDFIKRFNVTEQVYEKDGSMVVELRPLRTKEEREMNLVDVLPVPCRPRDTSEYCVPADKHSNLINSVNNERRNLGLKPIRVP